MCLYTIKRIPRPSVCSRDCSSMVTCLFVLLPPPSFYPQSSCKTNMSIRAFLARVYKPCFSLFLIDRFLPRFIPNRCQRPECLQNMLLSSYMWPSLPSSSNDYPVPKVATSFTMISKSTSEHHMASALSVFSTHSQLYCTHLLFYIESKSTHTSRHDGLERAECFHYDLCRASLL